MSERIPQGCGYCNHPLFCAIKCPNCGKVFDDDEQPTGSATYKDALIAELDERTEPAQQGTDEQTSGELASGECLPVGADPLPDLNFCARCGKPIWHADASSIHTCTPPDKTRQGPHWNGCEETRGHHDCAIRKIAALRAERDAFKADAERYRWLRSKNTGPCQIWETVCESDGSPLYCTLKHTESLDAAIDEARGRGMAGSGDA